MQKVLVLHGQGMDLRGTTQVDIFGPMTLAQYDEHIRRYASDLGITVEISHSNVEADVINTLNAARAQGVDGLIFNPAGYMPGRPALLSALAEVGVPAIEVHISNPARRGKHSDFTGVVRGTVTGFGIYGYYLALLGLRDGL